LRQCAEAQSAWVSQRLLSLQRTGQSRPQSTSDSRPSRIPLLQLEHRQVDGVAHAQCALAQSAGALHERPSTHGWQAVPPQSMAVSAPLRMPSVHDTHRWKGLHTPLAQSVLCWHICVRLQGLPTRMQPPPQSVSVSSASLTPLAHVEGAAGCTRHRELVPHVLVLQSVSLWHCWPTAHFAAQSAPQSGAGSRPSTMPLKQLAHRRMCQLLVSGSHWLDMQSPFV
jgi:hypothetical protein